MAPARLNTLGANLLPQTITLAGYRLCSAPDPAATILAARLASPGKWPARLSLKSHLFFCEPDDDDFYEKCVLLIFTFVE